MLPVRSTRVAMAMALLLCAPPGRAQEDDHGAFECGTSPVLQQQLLQRLNSKPLPRYVSALDQDVHNIAVLEDNGDLIIVFNSLPTTDSGAIASRFYASHADDYDYIAIFVASTFPKNVYPEGGFAFENNISNDVEGINFPIINTGGNIAPGLTRLKSLLNMNDLGEYNEDPSEELSRFRNVFSGVDVLGQEALHMVAAFIQLFEVDILGRGQAHWNFFMQTYGSVMEGNEWQQDGPDFFISVDAASGFSQLDNYLLGYLAHDEVTEPMYVIQSPTPNLATTGGDNSTPTPGVFVTGEPISFTMSDIILVNGWRRPDPRTSQKTYRMAWILVTPQGQPPATRDLEKIDDFRHQWQAWWHVETLQRGTMISNLSPAPVTADFESRVVAGAPGVTVTFDNDSFGDITDFEWDFGDGQTSSERHPVHTYTTPGTYDVTLTVYGLGGPAVIEKPGYIQVGEINTLFFDDFETDRGWGLDARDTATAGKWERGEPNGTINRTRVGNSNQFAQIQPEFDHSENGEKCFVTGNLPGRETFGDDEVDGGVTTLVSPLIDLSGSEDPILSFWHWFTNNSSGSPGRDPFVVEVSNDGGVTWARLRTFWSSHHYWREEQIHIVDVLPLSDRMRFRFIASEDEEPSIVEAAVDDFHVFEVEAPTPVLLEDFAAQIQDDGVRLAWSFAAESVREIHHVVVQRATQPQGPFVDRGQRQVAQSRMEFFDTLPRETAQFWYRLSFETVQGSQVSAEIRVDFSATNTLTRLESLREISADEVLMQFVLSSAAAEARLEVYDVLGHRLKVLEPRHLSSGRQILTWDRRDQEGRHLARGLYFVRLWTPGLQQTLKIALTR